jgi:hypothetical protein
VSDVTERIRRWRAGVLTREQLVGDLCARRWPQPSHTQVLGDRWDEALAPPFAHEEGTWGEIDRARERGLLPHDLYLEILAGIQARLDRDA